MCALEHQFKYSKCAVRGNSHRSIKTTLDTSNGRHTLSRSLPLIGFPKRLLMSAKVIICLARINETNSSDRKEEGAEAKMRSEADAFKEINIGHSKWQGTSCLECTSGASCQARHRSITE